MQKETLYIPERRDRVRRHSQRWENNTWKVQLVYDPRKRHVRGISGSGKLAASWILECNLAVLAQDWGENLRIEPEKALSIWGSGDWWRGSDWSGGESRLDEGENWLDWVRWSALAWEMPRMLEIHLCGGTVTTKIQQAWLSESARFIVGEEEELSLTKQLLSGHVMDEGREDG